MNHEPDERAPTRRFSDRVAHYVGHRPSYPGAVLAALETHCGLSSDSVVADMGSGTGIFTALLLQKAARVFAVEPNAAMRQAAEASLDDREGFISVAGGAEASTLAGSSVDLVTAAQSFHWFDRGKARSEFRRILRPEGWIALVWNRRKTDSAFQIAYEQLLIEHAPEYAEVNHRNISDESIAAFLGKDSYHRLTFANHQDLSLEGLEGRAQSASYAPKQGSAEHAGLMRGLAALFAEHASAGRVVFEYETELHIGRAQ